GCRRRGGRRAAHPRHLPPHRRRVRPAEGLQRGRPAALGEPRRRGRGAGCFYAPRAAATGAVHQPAAAETKEEVVCPTSPGQDL
ncbi:hypothetical protein CH063_14664, partial [Colletotrichum higginsianum]